MKCAESKELLSVYVDGLLDGAKPAALEAHLQTCRACAAELGSLRSLLEGLQDMEPVRAPADFLQQLHRRMERPRGWQRVRELLFRPARVKIPLQLAGALATALLVFSIVLHQQGPVSREAGRPAALEPGEVADLREKEEAAPAARAPAETKSSSFYAAAKGGGRDTAPVEWVLRFRQKAVVLGQAVEQADAPVAGAGGAIPETPRKRMAAQEFRASEVPAAVGRAESDGARDMAPEPSPVPDAPLAALERAVLLRGGRVLAVREGPSRIPTLFEVEIPAAAAEAFRRSLEAIGELQVPERGADADDAAEEPGPLRLRIRIE